MGSPLLRSGERRAPRGGLGLSAPPATTLVTGASSGIGRHLSLRLARAGDPLAVVARRGDALESLCSEIRDAGGTAVPIVCDVTDAEAVRTAVEVARKELGEIDRLVTNAGGGDPTFVDRFRAAQIEDHFRVNTLGVAHFVEALLPAWRARRSGHIVANSSLAAVRGLPTAAAYASSKSALSRMLESLRIDLRADGIDVTVIELGRVRLKKKSKKSRVTSISLEQATERMHRAILRREAHVAYPRRMAWIAAIGRNVPARLMDPLLAGRGRTPKGPAVDA